MSVNDTGWKPIEQVVGDDGYARGIVQPVTGMEQKPCFMCRSWEKNEKRLREHIASKKDIEVLLDGTFRHIADRDIPGRKSKTYNVRDFGFCRFFGIPAQQLHTCEHWVPTKRLTELARKLGR